MSTIKIAIVTASDSRYFPLLKGLVQSMIDGLTELQKQSSKLPVISAFPFTVVNWQFNMTVLNGGLEEHEVQWLVTRGVNLKAIEYHTLDYGGRERPSDHMAGFVERHALPKHVPGYNLYLWIDADAWVQDFNSGVMPYILLAARGHLAIVPEVDRQIAFSAHHRNITKAWALGNYEKFFSKEIALTYSELPMFNNGVFAASATNPVWDLWASSIQFALDKNDGKPEFGIDQISLNFVIYSAKEVRTYPLPLLCNWMVPHSFPLIDNDTGKLVGSLWPHTVIGVVHLLDNTKWNRVGIQRINRNDLSIVSGDSVHLEYGWMKKGK